MKALQNIFKKIDGSTKHLGSSVKCEGQGGEEEHEVVEAGSVGKGAVDGTGGKDNGTTSEAGMGENSSLGVVDGSFLGGSLGGSSSLGVVDGSYLGGNLGGPSSLRGGCGGEVMAGLLIRRYQDVLMDCLDEAGNWLGDDWKDKRVNRASGIEEEFVPVLDDMYRLAKLMRLDADKLIHGQGNGRGR